MRRLFVLFVIMISLGLGTAYGQTDSLRPHRDEFSKNLSLYFKADSLKDNSDTIRVTKFLPYDFNITIKALIKNGAPIGLCRSYYADGSICDETMFDSIPKKVTEQTGTDGYGDSKRYYLTTPVFSKKYYRNHKLWEESTFKPNPNYSELGYQTWMYVSHKTYFRNGQLDRYELYTDTLKISITHNYSGQLEKEYIVTKDSIFDTYCFYDGNLGKMAFTNTIVKTVMKKKDKDNENDKGDKANRTVYYYTLDRKLIKIEKYKNDKLVN
ncbi:MAG: hypothetical protein IT233_00705 [Bacteroidia bacterium]|nr:hypothetical protein [Bacteroidia bacterium]